MRTYQAAIVVGLCATLLGCGADRNDALSASTTAAPQPTSDVTFPPNGESVDVVALDNNFLPETVEVKAGTEVVFTNNGRNPHNVVPADDPKATEWGVLEEGFQPTDTYSRVFDRPGTYIYYCTIHGSPKAGMVGTITVAEP